MMVHHNQNHEYDRMSGYDSHTALGIVCSEVELDYTSSATAIYLQQHSVHTIKIPTPQFFGHTMIDMSLKKLACPVSVRIAQTSPSFPEIRDSLNSFESIHIAPRIMQQINDK